ncbi:Uma2 family endonuclease [Leptolyngbya cf. ectocarpi LEGE 11479]|uniref:Uma2 family endonuclease n=1 Tax=Leptolyngbya cf. ectocarpi LEGE 11479 TaxID=1828722 RepID=A0A929FCL3_LEPEC|nr:Uma2 family endonuclease [Leptolyngbya ectocarpi]MBE9070119.1 Uma2 family endonuclease [Leptolyngbya cf. ectocarpi LEGE 11479]
MVQTTPIISDRELLQLSAMNPGLRFERNADGSLVTMPPTGGSSGNREARVITRLGVWVEDNDLGDYFSSSTGFRLPNGAVRSPDAAFIAKGRLPAGWDQGKDAFITVVPDFVVEIRSQNDRLRDLEAKMIEYVENGVRLGWLLDRQNRQARAYRSDGSVTHYPDTAILNGESVLPGFTLVLKQFL